MSLALLNMASITHWQLWEPQLTNVKLNHPLVFEWTSVLADNAKCDAAAKKERRAVTEKGRRLWSNNVLVYEVTEMLVVKALALYNQAGITVGAVMITVFLGFAGRNDP